MARSDRDTFVLSSIFLTMTWLIKLSDEYKSKFNGIWRSINLSIIGSGLKKRTKRHAGATPRAKGSVQKEALVRTTPLGKWIVTPYRSIHIVFPSSLAIYVIVKSISLLYSLSPPPPLSLDLAQSELRDTRLSNNNHSDWFVNYYQPYPLSSKEQFCSYIQIQDILHQAFLISLRGFFIILISYNTRLDRHFECFSRNDKWDMWHEEKVVESELFTRLFAKYKAQEPLKAESY